MKLKKLKTSDIFTMSRIIKKMNIKDDIKKLSKNVTGLNNEEKKNIEQSLIVDITMLFVENIGLAEKECYKFFSDVTDKTAKEIEDMELKNFVNLIKKIFNQDGIGDFLSFALK